MIQTAGKEQTQLEQVLSMLSQSNSRFIETIYKLESIGHKIKDTNIPTKENSQEVPNPDGLLQQIGQQLEYYSQHNQRLENLFEKLSPLI